MWPKARHESGERWFKPRSLLRGPRLLKGTFKGKFKGKLKGKRLFGRKHAEEAASNQNTVVLANTEPDAIFAPGTLSRSMQASTTNNHSASNSVGARASRGAGSSGRVARSTWSVGGPESPSHGLEATVHDRGEGVPIVFLHGLVGLNEHWEGVVARVEHNVRCILFELPLLSLRGDDCSIQGVARLTADFLRDYLDEPAVLVGNSFGGHVALRVALEQPDLVRGLTLAGSSGLIEKSLVSDIQIRPSKEWLRRKIGELFHDQSLMREEDLERAHRELTDRGGARAMVKLSRSARRDHLGDKITQIQVPTLLLWGREDIVTPPEAAEGFHRMIRGSRLVWFENCGHAPMIERPEGFAEELLRFAATLPALARSSR